MPSSRTRSQSVISLSCRTMFIPSGVCLGTLAPSERRTHCRTRALHFGLYLPVNTHCSQAPFQSTPKRRKILFFFLKKALSSTRHTSSECGHAHTHTPLLMQPLSETRGAFLSASHLFIYGYNYLFLTLVPLRCAPKSTQCREASPCVYFAARAGGKRGPVAGLGSGFRVRVQVRVRVRVRVRARLLSSPQPPAPWQLGVSSRPPAPHHVFLGKRSVLLSSDKSQSQRQ